MRCLSCLREKLSLEMKTCPQCGSNLALMLRDSLPVGTALRSQTYRLDYPLGKGGFGITYLARHNPLDEQVAIKEYYPGNYVLRDENLTQIQVPPDYRENYQRGLFRFIEEGRFLAKLNHPNVVKVRDLFEEGDTAYLVMELVEGKPLSLALFDQPERKFSLSRVEKFVEQLVSALSVIHEAGIYHLDLKPENILLTPEDQVILIDFGAARWAKQPNDLSTRSYTESYAAPEIIAGGEIGAESDIFELGMMIHEMLTGTLPPPAMSRLLDAQGWQPSGLSPPWHDLIQRAIAIRREDRPSSVQKWWESRQQASLKMGRKTYKPAEKLRGQLWLNSLEQQGWLHQLGYGTIRQVFPLSVDLWVVITAGGAGLFQVTSKTFLWEIHSPCERGVIAGNGQFLALVWERVIYLWDLKSGQLLHTLEGHQKAIADLAISLDGQYLLSGSKDETLRLWDSQRGRELHCLTEPMGWVTAVAFSPDNLMLASGCQDGTIRLWERESGKKLQYLGGHRESITVLAFSPDGRQLASGSRDQTLQIWDVATGQAVHLLTGHHDWVTCLAFSADNQLLASGSGVNDKNIRLWYLADGQEIQQFQGHWNAIATLQFTPDNRYLISGSYDYSLRLWDMTQGKEISQYPLPQQWIYCVAYSPDNRLIATGHNDNRIVLWDAQQYERLGYLDGHEDAISSLDFSPNSQLLASGSWDTTVRIWDLASSKTVRVLSGHQNWVKSVAYSPNGQWLASGSWDKTIRIWDVGVNSWNLLNKPNKILQENLNRVEALAFSPDSQWLVTGSADCRVRVWEVQSGQKMHQLEGHKNKIEQVAFSPDGQFLVSASGDRKIYLWHFLSGKLMHRFVGHQRAVTCVAFSPNGHWIASGSRDTTLRLWDVVSGDAIAILRGHTGTINDLAFSPDSKHLVSVDQDGIIAIWQVGSQ